MKFWANFLRNTFKLLAQPLLSRVRPKLIESVLARSIPMLDPDMISEIREFIIRNQTPEGGFCDRAGKCDLYYSLFGWYLAESLSVAEVVAPLRNYVATAVTAKRLSGVDRYCGAILYAKLIGLDGTTEELRKCIVDDLTQASSNQAGYSGFLGLLALYYLEDYPHVLSFAARYGRAYPLNDHPCPVVAATAVIQGITGKRKLEAIDILKTYYRGNGGFAALHRTPSEDLLSTGVALYALQFLGADLRLIKPDCLAFVDGLYDGGGFRAVDIDSVSDVEYTFYGLLALGSLR
ncbi:MAG: prenyltransferase/squalene oxidase repeat-containing protein [Verrucomicrobiota bacterium]